MAVNMGINSLSLSIALCVFIFPLSVHLSSESSSSSSSSSSEEDKSKSSEDNFHILPHPYPLPDEQSHLKKCKLGKYDSSDDLHSYQLPSEYSSFKNEELEKLKSSDGDVHILPYPYSQTTEQSSFKKHKSKKSKLTESESRTSSYPYPLPNEPHHLGNSKYDTSSSLEKDVHHHANQLSEEDVLKQHNFDKSKSLSGDDFHILPHPYPISSDLSDNEHHSPLPDGSNRLSPYNQSSLPQPVSLHDKGHPLPHGRPPYHPCHRSPHCRSPRHPHHPSSHRGSPHHSPFSTNRNNKPHFGDRQHPHVIFPHNGAHPLGELPHDSLHCGSSPQSKHPHSRLPMHRIHPLPHHHGIHHPSPPIHGKHPPHHRPYPPHHGIYPPKHHHTVLPAHSHQGMYSPVTLPSHQQRPHLNSDYSRYSSDTEALKASSYNAETLSTSGAGNEFNKYSLSTSDYDKSSSVVENTKYGNFPAGRDKYHRYPNSYVNDSPRDYTKTFDDVDYKQLGPTGENSLPDEIKPEDFKPSYSGLVSENYITPLESEHNSITQHVPLVDVDNNLPTPGDSDTLVEELTPDYGNVPTVGLSHSGQTSILERPETSVKYDNIYAEQEQDSLSNAYAVNDNVFPTGSSHLSQNEYDMKMETDNFQMLEEETPTWNSHNFNDNQYQLHNSDSVDKSPSFLTHDTETLKNIAVDSEILKDNQHHPYSRPDILTSSVESIQNDFEENQVQSYSSFNDNQNQLYDSDSIDKSPSLLSHDTEHLKNVAVDSGVLKDNQHHPYSRPDILISSAESIQNDFEENQVRSYASLEEDKNTHFDDTLELKKIIPSSNHDTNNAASDIQYSDLELERSFTPHKHHPQSLSDKIEDNHHPYIRKDDLLDNYHSDKYPNQEELITNDIRGSYESNYDSLKPNNVELPYQSSETKEAILNFDQKHQPQDYPLDYQSSIENINYDLSENVRYNSQNPTGYKTYDSLEDQRDSSIEFSSTESKKTQSKISKQIEEMEIENLENTGTKSEQEFIDMNNDIPEDIGPLLDEMDSDEAIFDIVVLGSGPGILTAVEKLSELNRKIIIIEKGSLPPFTSISLYYRPSLLLTDYVTAIPASAPHCDVPKVVYIANAFGGITSFNTNSWEVGSKKKHNKWGQISKKWNWNTVNEYYKKVEYKEEFTETVTQSQTTQVIHPNGTVTVCTSVTKSVVTKEVEMAFVERGLTDGRMHIEDENRKPGFALVPVISEQKHNVVLAQQMLKSVKDDDNIKLALNTRVLRIIYSEDKAIAVEVETVTGQIRTIRIREQLILGIGPVNTVRLLTQSGMGVRSTLQELNIPLVRELPYLGQQLVINSIYLGLCVRFPQKSLIPEWDSDALAAEHLFGDHEMAPGMALNFYKGFLCIGDTDVANVRINFYAFSKSMSHRLRSYVEGFFHFDSDVSEYIMDLCEHSDILFLSPQILDVESRGTISMTLDKFGNISPKVDTGMFSDKKDMEIMLETIKVIESLTETNSFKSLGGELVHIPIKNCRPNDKACSIRYMSVPNLHYIGAAVMGNDVQTSVVNEDLLIHGTSNTYCFSSAVIPHDLSSDSIACTSMIGNYGADIIKEKYKNIN